MNDVETKKLRRRHSNDWNAFSTRREYQNIFICMMTVSQEQSVKLDSSLTAFTDIHWLSLVRRQSLRQKRKLHRSKVTPRTSCKEVVSFFPVNKDADSISSIVFEREVVVEKSISARRDFEKKDGDDKIMLLFSRWNIRMWTTQTRKLFRNLLGKEI